MRKYILFTACALTLFASAAQADSNLFPELKIPKKPVVQEQVQDKDAKVFTENIGAEIDSIQQQELIDGKTEEVVDLSIKGETKPVPETPKKSETEEKEKKSGFIEINPHDITIIMPPRDPNSQFCKGSLTLDNQTKYNLKNIKMRLLYGNARVPYAFSSIPSGQKTTGAIVLAGTYCQDLTRAANVDVEECELEGATEAECKQLVKYLIK